MPTPFRSRQPASTSWSGGAKTSPTSPNPEWCCTRCDKLLGVLRDGQLHIRFARGHQYLASLPTTCICRSCGTLNRTSGLTR